MARSRIIDINLSVVSITDEPHYLRSDSLLDGAVARPKNRFHYDAEEDMLPLAVTLMTGIIQNHPLNRATSAPA